MLVVLIIMLPLATLMLTLHNEKKRNCYTSVKKRNHYASVKNRYAYVSLWKEA